MALRYRGGSAGLILIDSKDTTPGLLASKLLAGSNISLVVGNVGGNETLTVSAVNLLALETVANPATVNASGQGPGVASKASASDHIHQLANPITGAVSIKPATNVVPLTLQTIGSSDILDLKNTAGSIVGYVDTSGNLVIGGSGLLATPRLKMQTAAALTSILFITAAGVLQIGDSSEGALPVTYGGGASFDLTAASALGDNTIFQAGTSGPGPSTTWAALTPATGVVTLGLNAGMTLLVTSVNMGAAFLDESAIAAPASPGANVRRQFVLSTQNQVSAKTSAGTLVYLEGRGAPNVTVAKSATSLAVSLSPSEPDTSYEITTTLAFNSTVFYSAKAVTGFTLNFGTAPAAASQLDWTVERRVSGAA